MQKVKNFIHLQRKIREGITLVRWLRENLYASFLLLILRLYLGWQWISAGWKKLTGESPFDASGFLKGALKKVGGIILPFPVGGEALLNNLHYQMRNYLASSFHGGILSWSWTHPRWFNYGRHFLWNDDEFCLLI